MNFLYNTSRIRIRIALLGRGSGEGGRKGRVGSNRHGMVASELRGWWLWVGWVGSSTVSQTYSKTHSDRWRDVGCPRSGGLSVYSLFVFHTEEEFPAKN